MLLNSTSFWRYFPAGTKHASWLSLLISTIINWKLFLPLDHLCMCISTASTEMLYIMGSQENLQPRKNFNCVISCRNFHGIYFWKHIKKQNPHGKKWKKIIEARMQKSWKEFMVYLSSSQPNWLCGPPQCSQNMARATRYENVCNGIKKIFFFYEHDDGFFPHVPLKKSGLS